MILNNICYVICNKWFWSGGLTWQQPHKEHVNQKGGVQHGHIQYSKFNRTNVIQTNNKNYHLRKYTWINIGRKEKEHKKGWKLGKVGESKRSIQTHFHFLCSRDCWLADNYACRSILLIWVKFWVKHALEACKKITHPYEPCHEKNCVCQMWTTKTADPRSLISALVVRCLVGIVPIFT